MAEGGKNQDEESGGERRRARRVLQLQSWRFAYEALTQVHLLKLFLFNSAISVPLQCVSPRAYILPTPTVSSSPVVVCEWESPEGDFHTVYVPMPLCLVDRSATFSVVGRGDHVEVKLKLLTLGGSFLDDLAFLGLSHKAASIKLDDVALPKAEEEDDGQFSLEADAAFLSAEHNLCFYCRNCSAKLTVQPFGRVQELPSTEWRELADHWFGACCCGSGVKTASLLSRFERLLISDKGICLVGPTTCVVHRNDLISQADSEDEDSTAFNEVLDRGMDGTGSGGLQVYPEPAFETTHVNTSTLVPVRSIVEESNTEVNVPVNLVRLDTGTPPTLSGDTLNGSTCHGNETDSMQICSGHNGYHGEVKAGMEMEGRNTREDVSNAKLPVNGFMSGGWNASSNSNWVPFNCHACSCLIGASSAGAEGVQLFKCHISTDASPGGPSDIFRYHTLERVFCSALLSSMEDNSSYRYSIRGLSSKALLLQLVLLNQESWNCFGACLGELGTLSVDGESLKRKIGPWVSENDSIGSYTEFKSLTGLSKEELPPVILKPVMKLMFRDASALNSKQLNALEDWGRNQQADDIYMPESEVKSLIESLHADRKLFPGSWASFQQFHFSFLPR